MVIYETVKKAHKKHCIGKGFITWTWDTKDKPAASMVKRSPCKDHICKPGIEVLASKDTELTVEGTKLDKAIPPALHLW